MLLPKPAYKGRVLHMRFLIDIALLVMISICTWGGYKKGLIGGVAGILAIVVALLGGSLLSSTYAHELTPALEPFVNGYVDSQTNREKALEKMGYGESDLSLNDILAQDPSLRYDYAYESIRSMGFYRDRAEELSVKAVAYAQENHTDMTGAVVAVLCETITYVGGLALAFLMLLILITALANMGNLSFRLPNMENLDEIGGTALGFLKGFILCVLLCWLLSYFGILIGRDTLAQTTLARFFLAFKFITGVLM